jgi:hypothetical protein
MARSLIVYRCNDRTGEAFPAEQVSVADLSPAATEFNPMRRGAAEEVDPGQRGESNMNPTR